ncbi:hypothetical protein JCM11491_003011 [Sporobolomyces phaffii]
MRSFTVATLLALSAAAYAQGEAGSTDVAGGGAETGAGAPGTEGTMTTMAGGPPADGSSNPADGGATGAPAGGAETGAPGAETGAPEGGAAATGAVPPAVQSFTAANGAALESLVSQQATDPSGAASNAQALLSSAYANPEVSSYIAANPTWSALGAQLTGEAGSSAVDSLGSGSQSGSASASGPQSGATTQAPTTTRDIPSASNNAPKSTGTAATSGNKDDENGAVSHGVTAGLALAAVAGSIAALC